MSLTGIGITIGIAQVCCPGWMVKRRAFLLNCIRRRRSQGNRLGHGPAPGTLGYAEEGRVNQQNQNLVPDLSHLTPQQVNYYQQLAIQSLQQPSTSSMSHGASMPAMMMGNETPSPGQQQQPVITTPPTSIFNAPALRGFPNPMFYLNNRGQGTVVSAADHNNPFANAPLHHKTKTTSTSAQPNMFGPGNPFGTVSYIADHPEAFAEGYPFNPLPYFPMNAHNYPATFTFPPPPAQNQSETSPHPPPHRASSPVPPTNTSPSVRPPQQQQPDISNTTGQLFLPTLQYAKHKKTTDFSTTVVKSHHVPTTSSQKSQEPTTSSKGGKKKRDIPTTSSKGMNTTGSIWQWSGKGGKKPAKPMIKPLMDSTNVEEHEMKVMVPKKEEQCKFIYFSF